MASSEASGGSSAQPNLHKQDLSKLDVTKLTPLSPEVISRQATINIGTIGHVAHGKSTVVKAISGVQTVRFKNELERNITIKLDKLQFDENGIITWPKQLKGIVPDNVHIIEESCMSVSHIKGLKKKLRRARPNKSSSTYSREYTVEQILTHKWNNRRRTWMFLIKWKGYSMEDNSWEPLMHLTHCTSLLNQYLTGILHSQLLDPLCQKLKLSNIISNQELLDTLKITNLENLPEKLMLQRHLMMLVPNQKWSLRQLQQGQRVFLMYQLVCRREAQLEELSSWEEMINNLVKNEAPIKVENNVDLECLPEGFTYVNSYLPTGRIKIPTEPTQFCDCTECGPKEKCCGKQEHNSFSYTKLERVNVNPGVALHECNKKCKCGPDCRNRVIQKGRKVPLCIFRTSNGCGWGVKAMRTIACGEFVCEYVGEVITHEEAEIRGKAYDKEGRTYLFDLDYNSRDNPYTVDAANFGNISHFINHSCDPNLGVYAVWINCCDPNLPRLALFALRKIEKNEEVTFDYMMNIDPVLPTSPEKSRFLRTPDKYEVIQNGRNICKCEADSCRRYLF